MPGACDVVAVTDSNPADLHKMYIEAPETQVLVVNSNEHVSFISQFCYLGYEIDFLLDDTNEIKLGLARLTKQ